MRQLIKYNFNRNLKVVKIPSILNSTKEESTFFNFFRNKCITRIDAEGKFFAAFQDNKNQAYISKVSEFWGAKFNPDIKFELMKGVRKVSCKAEKVFVLGLDGSVTMASVAESPEKVYDNESIIEWTLRVPVIDMATSKNYAIFILGPVKMSEIRKNILLEEGIANKE